MFCSAESAQIHRQALGEPCINPLFFRRGQRETRLAVVGSELNLRLTGLNPVAHRLVPLGTPDLQLALEEAQVTLGSHVIPASLLQMCALT